MQPILNLYRLIPLTPSIASDDGACRLCDWVLEAAAKEYVRRARGAQETNPPVTILMSITRRLNVLEFQVVCARPRVLAAFDAVLETISGFGAADSIREGHAQPRRARVAHMQRWLPYGLAPDQSLDWRCLVTAKHRFSSPLTQMSTDELLWFLGKVANRSPVHLSGTGAVSDDVSEHRLLRLLGQDDRLEAVETVLARVRLIEERPQSWVLGPSAPMNSVAV